MPIALFLKGWAAGLAIAMPLGAIGMICLRYALAFGTRYGLASGLGVALADAVCAFFAAIGVQIIREFLASYGIWMQVAGCLCIFFIGIKIFLTKTPYKTRPEGFLACRGIILTMFFLTLTNPLTLLTFVGLFAGFGLEGNVEAPSSLIFVTLGVFLGSMSWWLVLSKAASLISKKTNLSISPIFNKITGLVILIFGFIAVFFLYAHEMKP